MVVELAVAEKTENGRKHLGLCQFEFLPNPGDLIEVTPVMAPPKSHAVLWLEHQTVHESSLATKAGKLAKPTTLVIVDEGRLIPDLL